MVVGISLIALNSWLNFLNNCYELYPSTCANGTCSYPAAYYTCEGPHQIFSPLLTGFGIASAAIGFLTVLGSIAVSLGSEYRNRTRPPLPNP